MGQTQALTVGRIQARGAELGPPALEAASPPGPPLPLPLLQPRQLSLQPGEGGGFSSSLFQDRPGA